MLTELLNHLKPEIAPGYAKEAIWNLECVAHILSEEYAKDANAKDALLDTAIAFLQAKKTQPSQSTSSQ